jgi:hypothetical protein
MITAIAHGHLGRRLAAARHGEKLEFALKKRMGWIGNLNKAIVNRRSASSFLVLA